MPIVAFTCTRAQKSHFPKNILDEIVEISTFITVQPKSMFKKNILCDKMELLIKKSVANGSRCVPGLLANCFHYLSC